MRLQVPRHSLRVATVRSVATLGRALRDARNIVVSECLCQYIGRVSSGSHSIPGAQGDIAGTEQG